MTIIKFFTPEEQKKILSMRENGYSILSISLDMHRSRRNVAKFLNDPESYMEMMQKSLDRVNSKSRGAKRAAKSTPVKMTTPVKKKVVDSRGKLATKAKSPVKFKKTASAAAAMSTIKYTPRELAEFNKVSLEHRCVIKFLTKLGEQPKTMYWRLKKAYAPFNPEMPAIRYWATQFRKGRHTILNDSVTVKTLSNAAKNRASGAKDTSKSVKQKAKPSTPTPASKQVVEKEDNKEKSENEETAAKFTIKLPGLDRLPKKSFTAG